MVKIITVAGSVLSLLVVVWCLYTTQTSPKGSASYTQASDMMMWGFLSLVGFLMWAGFCGVGVEVSEGTTTNTNTNSNNRHSIKHLTIINNPAPQLREASVPISAVMELLALRESGETARHKETLQMAERVISRQVRIIDDMMQNGYSLYQLPNPARPKQIETRIYNQTTREIINPSQYPQLDTATLNKWMEIQEIKGLPSPSPSPSDQRQRAYTVTDYHNGGLTNVSNAYARELTEDD